MRAHRQREAAKSEKVGGNEIGLGKTPAGVETQPRALKDAAKNRMRGCFHKSGRRRLRLTRHDRQSRPANTSFPRLVDRNRFSAKSVQGRSQTWRGKSKVIPGEDQCAGADRVTGHSFVIVIGKEPHALDREPCATQFSGGAALVARRYQQSPWIVVFGIYRLRKGRNMGGDPGGSSYRQTTFRITACASHQVASVTA